MKTTLDILTALRDLPEDQVVDTIAILSRIAQFHPVKDWKDLLAKEVEAINFLDKIGD